MVVGIGAPSRATEPGPPPAMAGEASLSRATAARVARLAMMDLRASESPGPRDYALAARLFEVAESLDPSNPEYARRSAEAWWSTSRFDESYAATRRLVRLDPKDTVAQLRLITAGIGRLQSVEERLAAYERFLGRDGASLDASIRSRLALDAALLSRERGDEAGYVSGIRRAATLDATNKDAALLLLRLGEETGVDPATRLELVSNLLLADPLDPQVHRRFVDELGSAGAFAPARRFHEIIRTLTLASQRYQTFALTIESAFLEFYIDGPEKPYEHVTKELAALRAERARELREREKLNIDAVGLAPPEEVRLPIEVEPWRLILALAQDDADALQAIIEDLAKTASTDSVVLTDRARRPAGMTDAQAFARARDESLIVQLWRLVTDLDTPRVPDRLDTSVLGLPEHDPSVCAGMALLAARAGRLELADEMLSRASGTSFWFETAKAVVLEIKGDVPGAYAAYRLTASLYPFELPGVFAHVKAEQIGRAHGLSPPPESVRLRARLAQIADAVPTWVDAMAANPRSFEVVSVQEDRLTAGATEPVRLRVSIRNVSQKALGLGAGRPISTRFLLVPSIEIAGRTFMSLSFPEVADLEQRLRLKPGEQVEAVIEPGLGVAGLVMETASGKPGRVRWRVVQGFVQRGDGARVPGPACVEVNSGLITRSMLDEASLDRGELARRVAAAPEADLLPLLTGVRASIMAGDRTEPTLEERRALAQAVATRYPSLSPLARALVLTIIPPSTEIPELADLDEVIARETDPSVLPVAIVARASSIDNPLLAACDAPERSIAAEVACLQRERLEAGAATYSTRGSGTLAGIVSAMADRNLKLSPMLAAPVRGIRLKDEDTPGGAKPDGEAPKPGAAAQAGGAPSDAKPR